MIEILLAFHHKSKNEKLMVTETKVGPLKMERKKYKFSL